MTRLKSTTKNVFLIFCLLLTIASCKKELLTKSVPIAPGKNKDGIPIYPFDWETANYVPTAPGQPQILIPWANGSVQGFSSDLLYDFKKADGWKLVYSSFNPNYVTPTNPFFVLYNRYRGLLRVYLFSTVAGYAQSSYLTNGLSVSGSASSSSPLLNYIGKDIVRYGTNTPNIVEVEQTQLATNVWYAAQYEMAYDSNLSTTSYQNIGLYLTLKYINITQENLTGTQTGTITGTITTPNSTPNSLFSQGGTAALEVTGIAGATAIQKDSPVKDFANIVSNILQNGLGGTFSNFLSGIFGGSSASTQTANLNLSTTLQLAGNSSGGGAVVPDPGLLLGVPGTYDSQSAPGYLPNFPDPLGVFYIANTPTAGLTIINTPNGSSGRAGTGGTTKVSAFLNTSSINLVFNPAVINTNPDGASVSNIRYQIVVTNPRTNALINISGTVENATGRTIYAGFGNNISLNYSYTTEPFITTFPASAAVRVIFDVNPNSGAPKTTMIHTFSVNVQ